MDPAQPEIAVDDEGCRVTIWRLAPGSATGLHRHEFDYVVVPVTGGQLQAIGADGSATELAQGRGEPYVRAAGAVHDVGNPSEQEVVFVEVELKQPPLPPTER